MGLLTDSSLEQDACNGGAFAVGTACAEKPAAVDGLLAKAQLLALHAGGDVPHLHGADGQLRHLVGGETVQKRANVGDIVHVAADVDARGAHGEGIDLVGVGKFVVVVGELAAEGQLIVKLKIRREAEVGKAHEARVAVEHDPLGHALGDELIAVFDIIAAVAAHGIGLAPDRPGGDGDLLHELRVLVKIDPRVRGDPILIALGERGGAVADLLGVQAGGVLEQGKGGGRIHDRLLAAQVGRDSRVKRKLRRTAHGLNLPKGHFLE